MSAPRTQLSLSATLHLRPSVRRFTFLARTSRCEARMPSSRKRKAKHRKRVIAPWCLLGVRVRVRA